MVNEERTGLAQLVETLGKVPKMTHTHTMRDIIRETSYYTLEVEGLTVGEATKTIYEGWEKTIYKLHNGRTFRDLEMLYC